ncbi:MAG: DUF3800 domain-containing protein [Parachlamydiales bacterium]
MQLFFIDESGSIPPPGSRSHRHFVVGGIVVAESQWHPIAQDLRKLKQIYGVDGEIKWRYFGQRPGFEDSTNVMRHLDRVQRDELRVQLFRIINDYSSCRILSTVSLIEMAYGLPYIVSQEDLYWHTYKPLADRFQYYLQDVGREIGAKINGIIICDHRERGQDNRIRRLHSELLDYGSPRTRYRNLIEGLFLAPSHLSIGIQLADLVVGAIFRMFEHGDDRWLNLLEPSWRRSKAGELDGFGLVRFPKRGWAKKMTLSGSQAPDPATDAVSA